MVSVDYIYASENNLDITAKGKAALKTRQRVDIQKTYLKDIIVDMITGVVYDADTVKVSNPHPRDVLLESVIKIDSSYLDSHFQEINSLYQLSLKNNSIFGNSSVTSELYKIIGISYSELHYAENRVYMYKSESAFERPVVYTMSTCDFDKKAVSKLSGMLIARYNLAGYLSETSTQNNASPRKQKSNN